MKNVLYSIKENLLTALLVMQAAQGVVQVAALDANVVNTFSLGVLTFYMALLVPGEANIKIIASAIEKTGADGDEEGGA